MTKTYCKSCKIRIDYNKDMFDTLFSFMTRKKEGEAPVEFEDGLYCAICAKKRIAKC